MVRLARVLSVLSPAETSPELGMVFGGAREFLSLPDRELLSEGDKTPELGMVFGGVREFLSLPDRQLLLRAYEGLPAELTLGTLPLVKVALGFVDGESSGDRW